MKYEVLQTTLIFFNNGGCDTHATLYIDSPGATGYFFLGEKGTFINSTSKYK